jgi:hypothetical protein
MQTVTVNLPDKIYQRVKKQSKMTQRSIPEEVAAVLADALTDDVQLPETLELELSQLQFLTDEELWRAARLRPTSEEADQMQVLLERQQREGLTRVERQEVARLSDFFNRIMLVRAEAAVQLKQRGYDVNSIITAPAEGG